MPLNEDSSVLSAFREMGYVPVFSKKRGTRGNPESLKSLTEKFLIKIKNRNPSLLTRIRTDWGKIAGANFAKYCEPQNIRAGILYIAAENLSLIHI